MITVIKVNGMMCEHCKKSVTDGRLVLSDVRSVDIDLAAKTATIEHDCEVSRLLACIEDLGFEPEI